jgi:hypothetical protein
MTIWCENAHKCSFKKIVRLNNYIYLRTTRVMRNIPSQHTFSRVKVHRVVTLIILVVLMYKEEDKNYFSNITTVQK